MGDGAESDADAAQETYVCIKGPLVRNLKNEIIKFYDKLGFKASFPLISERNLLFLLY